MFKIAAFQTSDLNLGKFESKKFSTSWEIFILYISANNQPINYVIYFLIQHVNISALCLIQLI